LAKDYETAFKVFRLSQRVALEAHEKDPLAEKSEAEKQAQLKREKDVDTMFAVEIYDSPMAFADMYFYVTNIQFITPTDIREFYLMFQRRKSKRLWASRTIQNAWRAYRRRKFLKRFRTSVELSRRKMQEKAGQKLSDAEARLIEQRRSTAATGPENRSQSTSSINSSRRDTRQQQQRTRKPAQRESIIHARSLRHSQAVAAYEPEYESASEELTSFEGSMSGGGDGEAVLDDWDEAEHARHRK